MLDRVILVANILSGVAAIVFLISYLGDLKLLVRRIRNYIRVASGLLVDFYLLMRVKVLDWVADRVYAFSLFLLGTSLIAMTLLLLCLGTGDGGVQGACLRRVSDRYFPTAWICGRPESHCDPGSIVFSQNVYIENVEVGLDIPDQSRVPPVKVFVALDRPPTAESASAVLVDGTDRFQESFQFARASSLFVSMEDSVSPGQRDPSDDSAWRLGANALVTYWEQYEDCLFRPISAKVN